MSTSLVRAARQANSLLEDYRSAARAKRAGTVAAIVAAMGRIRPEVQVLASIAARQDSAEARREKDAPTSSDEVQVAADSEL